MNNNQLSLKILIVSEFDGQNANVIRDFLFCFNKYSRHEYYYIFDPEILNGPTDLLAFDVILLFWSVYLPGEKFSEAVRQKIRQAPGLKVLFLQDEYRNVQLFNQRISELGVELMFTCVAEKDHQIFYPPERIPSLQATYSVLTGYVPSYLERLRPSVNLPRPIDVAYRSRSVPYYLGDLGREKTIIAQRFTEIARENGFRADISVREQDRIYGDAWVKFLKSSRFVLGSPSGASVIDFSGDIGRNCENYLALYPNASYEDVKQRFFADVDGKLVIDTVSPRIFESTALGCAMVMHEGYYGGILEAGRHYICVKKDYSNIKDVVAQMRDEAFCREIARNAYHDLIRSGKYSYQAFAKWFDRVLDKHMHQTARATARSKISFYAQNYFRAGQTLVPYSDRAYSLPFASTVQRIILMIKRFRRILIYFQWPRLPQLIWKCIKIKYSAEHTDHPPSLKKMLVDLSLLSILNQIVDGQGSIAAGFEVRLVGDHQEEIRFVSCPIAHHGISPKGSTRQPEENNIAPPLSFMLSAMYGKPLVIEWDHSQVGTYLKFIHKSKTYMMEMGTDGRYKFSALSILAQHHPDFVAEALGSIYDELRLAPMRGSTRG